MLLNVFLMCLSVLKVGEGRRRLEKVGESQRSVKKKGRGRWRRLEEVREKKAARGRLSLPLVVPARGGPSGLQAQRSPVLLPNLERSREQAPFFAGTATNSQDLRGFLVKR